MSLNRLNQIKKRATSQESKVTINTEFYFLAKELGCLPELIGREFEFIKDENGVITGFRQKPISIPTFINLMNEMEKGYKRQEREMNKSKGRRR